MLCGNLEYKNIRQVYDETRDFQEGYRTLTSTFKTRGSLLRLGFLKKVALFVTGSVFTRSQSRGRHVCRLLTPDTRHMTPDMGHMVKGEHFLIMSAL